MGEMIWTAFDLMMTGMMAFGGMVAAVSLFGILTVVFEKKEVKR